MLQQHVIINHYNLTITTTSNTAKNSHQLNVQCVHRQYRTLSVHLFLASKILSQVYNTIVSARAD